MTIKNFVYSIYDRKAQYFLSPFVCRSDADATRAFIETVKQPDMPMSLYPSDFDLVCVGSFDLETGVVERLGPVVMLNGLNALEAAHREREKYSHLQWSDWQKERSDEAVEQSAPVSLSS